MCLWLSCPTLAYRKNACSKHTHPPAHSTRSHCHHRRRCCHLQDALQLFVVADNARATDGLVSVRLSGLELFQRLQQSDSLDGIVFNPAGPDLPIALAREVAAAVLAG